MSIFSDNSLLQDLPALAKFGLVFKQPQPVLHIIFVTAKIFASIEASLSLVFGQGYLLL